MIFENEIRWRMNKSPRRFGKTKIRGLELKKRIVMPLMGTHFAAEGKITNHPIEYYVEGAKGEVGLIIKG